MARLAVPPTPPTKSATEPKGSRQAAKGPSKRPPGSYLSTDLRLIFSPDETDNFLSKASTHLANGQPYQALQTYTKVLLEISPGHPCAFLNRSLAYIALDYPELAVADAYQAAMISYGMRPSNAIPGDRRLSTVARYKRAELRAKQNGEVWTKESKFYVGQGWLRVPLAAIYLNVDKPRAGESVREAVCTALELKAIYRMAYALWKCGGGALPDALGLMSDAKAVYKLNSEEEICFLALGNQIMCEIEEALSKEAVLSRFSSEDGLSDRQTEAKGRFVLSEYKGLLRRRYTMVRREVYLWNMHEPALDDPAVLTHFEKKYSYLLRGCNVQAFRPSEEKVPKLGLFARKDIQDGELVLKEGSALQVTTACASQTKQLYCNVCAALIIPPTGFAMDQKARATSKTGSTRLGSPVLDTPPDPALQQPLARFNVKGCLRCGDVYYCSSECRESAKYQFHLALCGKGVEDGIREAIQNHESLKQGIVHPKAEQIYELLLVRIYALSRKHKVHPLDLDEVKWLDGDLFTTPNVKDNAQVDDHDKTLDFGASPFSPRYDDPTRKTLPWSFEANVIRPFKWFQKMRMNPRANLDRCDAWVINTLLAKIMASTRITKGPRHVDAYDAAGRVVDRLDIALAQSDEEGQEVWIGSIHPIFSHVQIVDNQSDANVVYEEQGAISCVAYAAMECTGCPDRPDNSSMPVDVKMKDCGSVGLQEEKKQGHIKAGTLITRLGEADPITHSILASWNMDGWSGKSEDGHGISGSDLGFENPHVSLDDLGLDANMVDI